MKKIVIVTIMLVGFFFQGCSNIGDGKVDIVEAAVIQAAVDTALSAKPELVVPAHDVTTALLAVMDSGVVVLPSQIESEVSKEMSKLGIDPVAQYAIKELMYIIKAKIVVELNANTSAKDKMVVVKQIVQIVNTTSGNRLSM